jgi:hypothetical protein
MQIKFFRDNWYYLVFVFILCFYIVSLYHRVPTEDEAVIAGHSYFFNESGHVKSELYGGYLKGNYAWETRQYAYHKLYVLTGSLFLKVFGFNIYCFKSISLCFSILFFVILFLYLKKQNQRYSVPFFLLACSLLLFNNTFFDYSFMFRPEIMVMCLGFISFYFLEEGMKDNRNYYFLLSGMFAGLATFTHLNGLIYSFAGILLLIIRKSFLKCALFSIAAGLFTLLYFFDINNINDLNGMLYQFKTDPNVVDKVPFFIGLLNEHMRFFHSPKEAIFTLIFIFSLIINFKFLKENSSNLLIYLLFLVLGLGLLSHGKTPKYALNYYPFISLIIISAYADIMQKKKLVKITGGALLAIYIVIQGYYNIELINKKVDISTYSNQILNSLEEKNVKISAPSVYAFNGILNYTIRGEIAWDHHYYAFHPQETRSLKNYILFAKEHNDKYIIIDKTYSKLQLLDIFSNSIKTNDTIFTYRVIKKSPAYVILKTTTN